MNTILQCLSSTEDLVKYFINIYSKFINYKSRTKGLVAKEFSIVIKNLWSQSGRSFQCQKFKVCKSIKFLRIMVQLFEYLIINHKYTANIY